MRVTTWGTDKVSFYPNWRNRLLILLGFPITVETCRVTTLTQSQTYYSLAVGTREIMSVVAEPSQLNYKDDAPCIPWCSIIE